MTPPQPAIPTDGTTANLSTAGRARAIVAGSMGNLIEWYDFYVYAFTALYFSSEFFPSGDRTAQLLGTSGIFAVGFLLRPLGGWYFGRFADQHGRRRAMVVSILLMGVGSALIASLPTYATIGAFAPALLLLGRMIQGFSTGGQYGTAATYLSEIAFTGRRGFFASFQYVTLIGGQLLALAVILILQQVLDVEQMKAFGWRIPFAIGAVAALTILLFRHVLHETTNTDAKHPDAGTLRGLLPHWRAFLTVLGLTAGGSLMFYVFSTYMQKYLVNTAQMDAKTAFSIGILNKVVPFAELDAAVDALVAEIVAVSPIAVRRGKYAMRAVESMSFHEMMAFTETSISAMIQTEDAREGLAAFNARRPAQWQGR